MCKLWNIIVGIGHWNEIVFSSSELIWVMVDNVELHVV